MGVVKLRDAKSPFRSLKQINGFVKRKLWNYLSFIAGLGEKYRANNLICWNCWDDILQYRFVVFRTFSFYKHFLMLTYYIFFYSICTFWLMKFVMVKSVFSHLSSYNVRNISNRPRPFSFARPVIKVWTNRCLIKIRFFKWSGTNQCFDKKLRGHSPNYRS